MSRLVLRYTWKQEGELLADRRRTGEGDLLDPGLSTERLRSLTSRQTLALPGAPDDPACKEKCVNTLNIMYFT